MFILSPLHTLELGFPSETRLTTLLGLQALHFNTSIRSFQQEKPSKTKPSSPLSQVSYVNPQFLFPPKTLLCLQIFSPLAVNEHDEPHATTRFTQLRYPLLFLPFTHRCLGPAHIHFTSSTGKGKTYTHFETCAEWFFVVFLCWLDLGTCAY